MHRTATIILRCALHSLESHISALRRGLEQADLVLTTGGTSMGASDLLKPVIERHLGGTIHFGRVQIKPGKPTTFATVPVPASKKGQGDTPGEGGGEKEVYVPVFALPGNPASALVTFHVFVVPALRRLGGWPVGRCQLPKVRVQVRPSPSYRLRYPDRIGLPRSNTSCL